jgi:hypothetical protein
MTAETLSFSLLEEVQKSLQNMKSFIESAQHADWSVYNQAKKIFLDTFKEVPNNSDKQKIWKEFSEVTESARSIKKLQEEEGAYAADMILQAIDALELEIKNPKFSRPKLAMLEKVEAFKSFKEEAYEAITQVKFLNSKANQVQALRDELAKTGMRLSVKGRLFDRLSHLGDQIFPVKKELALRLNQIFFEGLNRFSKWFDKEEEGVEALFQIKLIQSFIKELNLKKADYDAVKQILDPIWKKAVILKEKKEVALKEAAEKSLEVKKGFDESFEVMKQLVAENKDSEAMALYDSLSLKLKDKQISRYDFKALKHSLEEVSSPLFSRLQEAKEQKLAIMKQQASANEEKKHGFKAVLLSEASLEDKKVALEEAIKLGLGLDETFSFELSYLKSKFEKTDGAELNDLYFELKSLQEGIRGALAKSSKDFSMSMNLQEISQDVKDLLTQIMSKI